MTLTARLVLTVALTALFSVSLTGFLSYRAASDSVPRAFGLSLGRGQGPGAADRPGGGGAAGVGAAAGGGAAAGVGAPAAGTAAHASLQLLGELQRATVQAAAIALAVAVAAGGWMALRSSRPLVRLADVTRRYGRGERSLRAPVAGPAEVASLARVFNATVDHLQAEEDQRRRFTTDIAHELRTPLTVLKSELEAIEDGLMSADPDTVRQLVQQVDLLTRLVQDLRLLTLAEAGELTLERSPTPLAEVVRGAVGGFASRAAQVGVRLVVEAEEVTADADPERLRQVVNALLDNALRHAPAGSEVRVVVGRRGDEATIEVLDEGPGVAAEHRRHVFRRLYRAEPSRQRETGGTGLGLAIVAAIMALHGGRAEALERDGGGGRFLVSLPSTAR
jgi:two-component system, OmpR family, sensor histidine kinase BaeS